MILRRLALAAVVVVIAAVAGIAARDLRSALAPRAEDEQRASEPANEGGVAAAPTPSPRAPKWSTRRLQLPPDLAVWSIRISADGASLAGLTPQPPDVGRCTAVDKVSPPSCKPPVPSRVLRYQVSDPPGEITATLTRAGEAPENGGFAWLPDGGLAVASLDTSPAAWDSMKHVIVTILEKDGRRTPLGSLEGGSIVPLSLSPDGKWLAVGQTQPPAVRFIDRATGTSKAVALDVVGLPVQVAWSADGRALIGKDTTLLRVSPDGAIDRVAGPEGARLAGLASVSPDGSIVVFRAHRQQSEGVSALVGGRWVDVPTDAIRSSSVPTWVTPHEILLRTAAGALQAYDPRTATTRDLGFVFRVAEPRVLAYSEPYLMWRDGDAGRIHLLDTRSAYDVIVGTSAVTGVQPYAGGGFLLVRQDSAELLTGADWFARVPPTAAPFVPAASPKPGTRDPVADVRALPRVDQMTTGGALTVESRTATAKRVSSPDGGWSVEVPSDWRADVGRLRGGELYSFDPTGMDYDGNVPPPGGVRMSIMLWPDYEQRGPVWYADNDRRAYPEKSRERTTVTVAGTTAERVITVEDQPTRSVPVARWFLRHPSFDDRIIETVLYRADEAALPLAERVVASLRLSEPVSGPREPLLSRAEAIAKAIAVPAPKPSAVPSVPERDEAKLVTWREYELAQSSSRGYTIEADTPVWVVVRFGDFEPYSRAMRGPGPFPNWTWQFELLDARTGQGIGGGGGSGGTEPSWWASLRDRSP